MDIWIALMQTIDESYLFTFRDRALQNNEIGACVYRHAHRISQAVTLRYSITRALKGLAMTRDSTLLLVPRNKQNLVTYNCDARGSHIE